MAGFFFSFFNKGSKIIYTAKYVSAFYKYWNIAYALEVLDFILHEENGGFFTRLNN